MSGSYAINMSKYDADEPSSSTRDAECRCSVAVGFLFILCTIIIAVGVGLIVHFAGNKTDFVCTCNITGLSSGSGYNSDGCVALAAANDPEICGACPRDDVTSVGPGDSTPPAEQTTTTPVKSYPLRLPDTMTPLLYTLTIKPDFYYANVSEFMFYGQSSVLVHCNKNTLEIFMHAMDLHIVGNSISVTKAGDSANMFESLEMMPFLQLIKLTLSSALVAGSNYTITVMDFSAPIRTDMNGLYRGSFQRNDTTIYYVTSQMEVTEARKVFPCFDEPSLKARFDITLVRQPNMVALSNMPLENTETKSDGWEHDLFERTPIMPTYLLAFIVSDFTYREGTSANGVPVRVWARKAAENQTEYGLEQTMRSITYLEDYLNIPYTLPRQDMIAIKDFIWTAMENWGLIVFREDGLLFEPGVSSERNKYTIFRYIAHELAHNWFGNLVSPSWWDDLWIKEGVATFFEYRVMDMLNPDWKVAEFFADDLTEKGFALDGLQSSHPLFLEGLEDPNDILRHYDSVSYMKGAAVTFMCEFLVGKDTFQRGFTKYLNEFAFGNAGHPDFFRAMETQAKLENKTLADDVVDVMHTFVYQMGYPTVHVEYTEQGKIRLTQSRYLEDPQSADYGIFESKFGYKWDIPFTFTSNTEMKFDKTDKDVILMDREDRSVAVHDEIIPEPVSDSWVLGNTQFRGYYRVNYDKRNWEALINQLITNNTMIDPLNRILLITDAFSFVRSGELDLDIALKILQYIDKERNYVPFNKLMKEILFLDKMLKSQPVYGKFKTFMQDSLKPLVADYGFIDDGADYIRSHMRGVVLSTACYYVVEDCVVQAKDLMTQWIANPSIKPPGINPEVAETVYCTAVKHGGENEWNFVMDRLQSENVETESLKLLKALACTPHTWLQAKLLHSILDTDSIPIQLVYRATLNAAHQFPEHTWDFFRNNYDELLVSLEPTWFGRLLKEVVDEFNTDLRLDELVRLGESKGDEKNAEHDIAVEHVKNNIKWMTNVDVVEEWLVGLGY